MNFPDRFFDKSVFIKIRPVGAELLRADGWTDNTKVIVAFRKVENAPKRRGCVIKVLKETAKTMQNSRRKQTEDKRGHRTGEEKK